MKLYIKLTIHVLFLFSCSFKPEFPINDGNDNTVEFFKRLIKETLQEIGFECVEAADVDQALKLFDEEKVDFVIADTFMPEKNGMDLLKILRENPENEELEIVLTMMEDHEELVSQGEALGMTGYVLKPFDVFSLSKSLDQMHKKEE